MRPDLYLTVSAGFSILSAGARKGEGEDTLIPCTPSHTHPQPTAPTLGVASNGLGKATFTPFCR